MTIADQSPRRFRVHARHIDRGHARLLEEASFEAAAIAYIERADVGLPLAPDHLLSVVVHEVATGHEHCFRIDLDTGEAAPCG